MNICRLLHVVLGLCLVYGCNSTEDSLTGSGSIYGLVTDFSTGEPIVNANVSLRPGGETTLTGSDGIYEFLNIPDGSYSLVVTKADYVELIDDYIIMLSDGRRIRRDVPIRKKMTDIPITDVYGEVITQLDFGSNNYDIVKSFNIYNDGTEKLECTLSYSSPWVKTISEKRVVVYPGQTVNVSIEIDRTLLNPGRNVTPLYISSNTRSNVLIIVAERAMTEEAPVVLTLPVTYSNGTINQWCDTFHATVISEGYPPYHSRGFCLSSTNKNPTINDIRINVSGTGIGDFSYTYRNFPPITIRYYVRAWVMYGLDNKIQYGDTQTFVYNDVL